MKIDNFDGEYRFLSNFYPSLITLDKYEYSSVEHAYQAAKTNNISERERIRFASTPNAAKRLGRNVTLRPNWNAIRIQVMYELVKQKFIRHTNLATMLRATGTAELTEGNWWNDTFWGVCKGQGENNLGKILMQVRSEI